VEGRSAPSRLACRA